MNHINMVFFRNALICLLVSGLLTAGQAENTDTPPVPIDLLLKSDQDTDFAISPDGEYLAFVQHLPRQNVLTFTNLDELYIERQIPLGLVYPLKINWISKRRVVFEFRGSIVTASVDGSETRVILPNIYDPDNPRIPAVSKWHRLYKDWTFLHALPENREEILVSGLNRKKIASVYRLNVFTGELTEVVDGKKLNVSQWWVDKKGGARLGISHKKDKVKFYVRDPVTGKINQLSVVNDEASYSLSYDGRSFVNQRVFISGFTDDDHVIYLAENIGKDRFQLVRYSLTDQKIVDTVIADERYDIGSSNTETRLHILDSEKKLVGVSYRRAQYHTEWFDDRFREYQEFLDERYPDNVNTILDWTPDLDRILVYSSSDKSPGKIVIYLTAEDKMALHSDFSPELIDYEMGDMRVVRFRARDGYELEGYLTMPPNHDDRPVPAIMIVHGGPWYRDFWGYSSFVQFFATRGFAVFQVNFRGSTGYGREHLLSGVQKISTLMLDDIADGANWLVGIGHARAEDLFIMGGSYGGYAALMSSVREPDLFKAVVSLSAPLDIAAQIKDYKKNDNFFGYEYWSYAVGDPRSQKKLLKQISPYYRMDDMSVPFIVFHGDQDPIVSVKQVERFEKALKKADVDGSVSIIRGEGHGLKINSNEAYFLESALTHFEKHLSEPADVGQP